MSESNQTRDLATTVIAAGTTFRGELTLTGPANILGHVEGAISSNGEVRVGASAMVAASIQAMSVLIDGVVQGDIVARERLQLGSKAKLTGDISAASFAVAEGASFAGRCNVGPEAVAAISTRNQVEMKPEARAAGELRPAAKVQAKSAGEWLEGAQATKGDWLASGTQNTATGAPIQNKNGVTAPTVGGWLRGNGGEG